MGFNIYYGSKVLEVLKKNPEFFKVSSFEILYLYLSCYKTVCCYSQTGPERIKNMIRLLTCFSTAKRM